MISFRQAFTFAFLFITFIASAQEFSNGLTAEYYNGTSFDHFVLSRIEKQINFSRKLERPVKGVHEEYFSIRWTGSIKAPATGIYTFYVLADDGIRIRVNHDLIIDQWVDQEAANFSGTILLEEGQTYDIKIEYYNSIIHSVLNVKWQVPEKEFQMFNSHSRQVAITDIPLPNLIPTSSPRRIRTDSFIVQKSKEITPSIVKVTDKPVLKKKKLVIPVETEKPIVLSTVVFEQQSASIKPESYDELEDLLNYMKRNPSKKIRISGHTDYLGDSVDNQILSEQRARAIASYLQKGGIEEARISSTGFGSKFPLVVSQNLKERSVNRRVEFTLE